MFIAVARFPIVDGDILAEFCTGLSSWDGLAVLPSRPKTMPQRLITLRDDSGPQSISTAFHRKGVNVWADSAVDAVNLALDTMALCRRLPLLVGPVKAATEFTGPYEVDDDPRFTFDGTPLTHYYFAFAVTVKAS